MTSTYATHSSARSGRARTGIRRLDRRRTQGHHAASGHLHPRLWSGDGGCLDRDAPPVDLDGARARRGQRGPLILLAADLGWWQDPADEWHVRGAVIERLGLDPARVLLALSHTHAGPSTYHGDAGQPGGHLVPPYLDALRDAAVGGAEEAQPTVSRPP